jgi:hypothetical protein
MKHHCIISWFLLIRSKHKCPWMGLAGGNENHYIISLSCSITLNLEKYDVSISLFLNCMHVKNYKFYHYCVFIKQIILHRWFYAWIDTFQIIEHNGV